MNVLQRCACVLSVAAVAVLSGCGTSAVQSAPPTAPRSAAIAPALSPSAGAAHSGPVRPCDLLTPQELAPLLGPGVNELDTSSGATSACAFTGAGVTTIVVDPTVGTSGFDGDCSTNNPALNIQTVGGIGDGACLSIVGGSIAVVYVIKGGDVMSINVQAGGATPVTSEQLIAVARSAADRL